MGCHLKTRHRLWLGGDLHLGEQLPPPSSFLKGLPGSGILNLEGPIANGPGWQKGSSSRQVVLRNHVHSPAWLRQHNVDAVSVLNNHRNDLGPKAIASTKAALKHSLAPASSALFALSDPWRICAAYLGEHEVAGVSPQDLEAIAAAYAQGKFVVVSVHIDGPPSYLPSPQVRTKVERLADAGAAVVALHGSHVIGPLQRRGPCLIAWGLGNLSFACPCSTEQVGLVLELQADARKTIQARVHPILTGHSKRAIQAHPDPDSIFELLQALESIPIKAQGSWASLSF